MIYGRFGLCAYSTPQPMRAPQVVTTFMQVSLYQNPNVIPLGSINSAVAVAVHHNRRRTAAVVRHTAAGSRRIAAVEVETVQVYCSRQEALAVADSHLGPVEGRHNLAGSRRKDQEGLHSLQQGPDRRQDDSF